MPESLDSSQRELGNRVDGLAREHLVALEAGPLQGRELATEVRAASKAAGVFGLTQPVEIGGSAGNATALAVAREALGRHNVGHLPGMFGPGQGLLGDLDEPLRSQFLVPYLAGEISGGFGMTEPDGAPRHTWATTDGKELVVNGQKSYVTGGADADFINTLVEVDGTGPAMVLIKTGLPGVELIRRFDTLDGAHHAAFTFTDVRVAADHVIGAPGKGMGVAMRQVTDVRMAIAANSAGLCAFVSEYLAEYLDRPYRGGGKLGDSERTRVTYGDILISSYGARSVLYRTARLIDSGENAVNEAMAAKVIATETLSDIVDNAIQIVGGQALSIDHPLAGIYQRVRSVRLAEGPTDVLRMNVARGRLDLGKGRV